MTKISLPSHKICPLKSFMNLPFYPYPVRNMLVIRLVRTYWNLAAVNNEWNYYLKVLKNILKNETPP